MLELEPALCSSAGVICSPGGTKDMRCLLQHADTKGLHSEGVDPLEINN